MIKLIGALRRNPAMTVQEFRQAWKRHAELSRKSAACTRYVRRYTQSYTLPEAYDDGAPPFDGVAEIWFDNAADMDAFYADREYREVLGPDLLRFADLTQSRRVAVQEQHVLPAEEPSS